MLHLCDDGCETPDHAYFTDLACKAREEIPFFSNTTWKANMRKSDEQNWIFKNHLVTLPTRLFNAKSCTYHHHTKQTQGGVTFFLPGSISALDGEIERTKPNLQKPSSQFAHKIIQRQIIHLSSPYKTNPGRRYLFSATEHFCPWSLLLRPVSHACS